MSLSEKVKEILFGIDMCETEHERSWWETSCVAVQGESKLKEVLDAIEKHLEVEAKRQASMRSLISALEARIQSLSVAAKEQQEAIATLESERTANAILTKELEEADRKYSRLTNLIATGALGDQDV